ncbi:MAG: hypothetical protein MR536_09640 [Prevotella sp.]|nr:hypothetical protein [Prevotella sp.]
MQRIFSRLLIITLIAMVSLPLRAARTQLMPIVSNFTQAEYKGGLQNWAAAQADNGTMFFGNNNGLLSFDGYHWHLHPLPGNSIVRSVLPDGNRVYVGTYTDFGYFEHQDNGQYRFTSLWPKNYQHHNDEIWKIIKAPNGHIYFQSFCSWFDYDGKNVTAHYHSQQLPLYFFPIDNRHIYVQMMNGGLALLQGKAFAQLFPRTAVGNDDIVGMVQTNGRELILATSKNGLYTLRKNTPISRKTSIDNELKQAQINKICLINPTTLVLGTILNGIYAININTGEMLWHYNMENSLRNNTVLALTTDKSGNVWAGLDNGISLIHTALPLTVMRTDQLQQPIGMVYGIVVQQPHIYIATNQALWQYHTQTKELNRVNNSGGQNWHIFAADNHLFAGHNLSTLVLQDLEATPIAGKMEGSTCMRFIRQGLEETIVESGYNHLNIYKKVNGSWQWSHVVEGFQSPILEFEIDNNGTLWAAHFSKGIYRIELSPDLKRVARMQHYLALEKGGVESKIHVMKIRGRVVFSYQGKLYTYDDLKHSIVPYQELSHFHFDNPISAVQADNHSFWVADNLAFTWLKYADGRYNKQLYIPYKAFGLEVNTNGVAMAIDRNDVYFYLNNGIGHYNAQHQPKSLPPFPLTVDEVTSTSEQHTVDTLACNGRQTNRIKNGNIRVVLSYPNFSHRQLTFHITIQGDGKTIKTKQDNPDFTFHDLGYGSYQLSASVTDSSGKMLATTQYSFEYPTPLYLSTWAFLLYLVVGYMLLRAYTSWRTQKIVLENKLKYEKELMEQHLKVLEQKQIIAHQQQIIMENELTNKGKELASMALQIATKSSQAETLREELIEKKRKGQLSVKDFERLISNMDNNNDTDMWNIFQQNFDLIHKNFFRNLRQRYPDLTPTDLKFCALLRLNYNTKDIVQFTHLTVRGVEGARYRLRKKLGISNEQSLTDFLIELE